MDTRSLIMFWFLSLIIAITSLPAVSSIELSDLGPEASNFIPACASACFLSFIGSNFPATACTTQSSLACLCAQRSSSGFTVAEGAVVCIVGGKNAGVCTGPDAADGIYLKAYNMCAGQTGALPNTHQILTATKFVATIATTALSTKTAITTSKSSLSTNAISQTSATSQSSRSMFSSSSSSILTSALDTAASKTTTPSSTASSTASGTAIISSLPSSTESASPVGLSAGQIGGIAAGAVGGVLALVLLLFLCCRKRRRKQDPDESDKDSFLLPFQLEEGNKTTVGGFRGPTEKWSGSKEAPPIKDRPSTTQRPGFAVNQSMTSVPGAIGLAVSPASKFKPDRGNDYGRRTSPLLPPKPTIAGFDNPRASPPKPQVQAPPQEFTNQTNLAPYNDRQSIATVFEEDQTSQAESASIVASTTQQTADTQGSRGSWTQPLSAGLAVAPLNFNRPQRTLSRGDQNYSRQMSQPMLTGSSVYSTQSFTRISSEQQQPGVGFGRRDSQQKKQQYKPYRPYKPLQVAPPYDTGSDTARAMVVGGGGGRNAPRTPEHRDLRNSNLSPVVESPQIANVSPHPTLPVKGSSLPRQNDSRIPQPLFTKLNGQEKSKAADLAVFDAFWRPQPQSLAANTSYLREQGAEFERQKRLRMSRATNTSQPRDGRQGPGTGRPPSFGGYLPTSQAALAPQPTPAVKDSIINRPRPTVGDNSAVRNSVQSATSANSSLLDRRGGSKLTPIPIKLQLEPTRPTIRAVGAGGEVLLSPRAAGVVSEEPLLSPGARSVTPRRIGNDLYLDMS